MAKPHRHQKDSISLPILDNLFLKLPKNSIGFAGLKDKHGITRQWFSFDLDIVSMTLRTKKIEKLLSI